MERGRKRWVLRLGVVLLVAAAMLAWALGHRSPSELTISNQSGQTVRLLRITAGEQTMTARDVAAGADVPVPFVNGADVAFIAEVTLANDARIRWRGQAGERLKLVILPNGNITAVTGQKGM